MPFDTLFSDKSIRVKLPPHTPPSHTSKFIQAMRQRKPILNSYTASKKTPALPTQSMLQKRQPKSIKFHVGFESHCRVCHKVYCWDDQLVFTTCCGNPIGSGCLEELSKKIESCFICGQSDTKDTSIVPVTSEAPTYIYRFGQQPEQEPSAPTELQPELQRASVDGSEDSISAAVPITGLATKSTPPCKSEHSLTEALRSLQGEASVDLGSQSTTKTITHRPDPLKARAFVQATFQRFIEAASVFEDHLNTEVKETFVKQLAKEIGVPTTQPPLSNRQSTSQSAGNSSPRNTGLERFAQIKKLEWQLADTIQGTMDVLYAPDAVDPFCGRCDQLQSRILNVLLPDESIP
ncbi:MAG: hypothetical protein Q9164_006478 [Protoblastenia rupestris]